MSTARQIKTKPAAGLGLALGATVADSFTAKPVRGLPTSEPDTESPDAETEKKPSHYEKLVAEAITAENYKAVPPLEWFVPGWIVANGITQVYGPPKAGKSFWTLALALEAARGGQWCDNEFKEPQRVLYIAPEAITSHIERIKGWVKKHGTEMPDTLTLLPTQVDIAKDESVSAISQYMREHGPFDLVVLDTLASATPDVEENGSEMKRVTTNLETIRTSQTERLALIIVHHTGKDISKGGRGHSSLLGSVHAAILVTKESDGLAHKVEMKDLRDGKEPLPLYYRIEPVELPPLPGDVLAREVGIMVPVGYVDAVQDKLTALYDALVDNGYKPGDTFKRTDITDLPGAPAKGVHGVLNRGIDRGLWAREGNTRATYYRLKGRPGDVGSLV